MPVCEATTTAPSVAHNAPDHSGDSALLASAPSPRFALLKRDRIRPTDSSEYLEAAMPLAGGPRGLRVRGSALVDAHGTPVCLRGVNWFGFNNGGTMARHFLTSPPLAAAACHPWCLPAVLTRPAVDSQVDGLWADAPIAADFASVVHRQMLLGALRAQYCMLMSQDCMLLTRPAD